MGVEAYKYVSLFLLFELLIYKLWLILYRRNVLSYRIYSMLSVNFKCNPAFEVERYTSKRVKF